MKRRPALSGTPWEVLAGAAVLGGLYLISLQHYLLFHALVELFSIAIGVSLFILAWNSRRILENNYLLFIGIAYLSVSLLTAFHLLSYKGMGVFAANDANPPTQLWIASRFVLSISLVAAPYFLKRRLRDATVLLFFLALTVALLFSIFVAPVFPVCYVEGRGLTPFKVYSEYAISSLFVAALVLLYRSRGYFDGIVLKYLAASILFGIGSELAFTLYLHVYGLANLIGHFFEIISFYLIYKAIIETGLAKPYRLLFRNIVRQREALQESEMRLRAVVDNLPLGVWFADKSGTILYGNAAGQQIWCGAQYAGPDNSPACRARWADSGLPLNQEDWAVHRAVTRGETSLNEVLLVECPGGARKTILNSVVPLRAPDGTISGAVALAEDITARKRAEEEFTRQKLILDTLMEATSDQIAMLDRQQRFIYANSSALQVLGKTREEVIGGAWREMGMPAEVREQFGGTVDAVFASGEVRRSELSFPQADGLHRYEYLVNPVVLTGGRPDAVVINARDITERQKVEMELKDRSAQLEAANRELESFSYSVSHDLRAPLRAIDGYARMILGNAGHLFDKDTLQKFNVIRESAGMMGQLIDGLLSFSRLGRTEIAMARIDMEGLFRDAWQELQVINPDRAMNLNIKELPACRGDRLLLKQVWLNLLSNAIKFTKVRNSAWIEVGGRAGGTEIEYYVRDNGVGFDMEYADKLFGVFQRLHSADDFEGTGVGLAIVQRIIHRHGGQVHADGSVDHGACFYFSLRKRE